ncbi:MAG: hypothetical protein HW388_1542 [Dehalococcoidia bacterium]|nr:hypothetical protein [Dehalococcoidia bacterium]
MRDHAKRLLKETMRSQSGFTLVELLVVVTIVVALAAASVVSVIQFAGKGEEGASAAELDTVQAAMDTMMASTGSTTVTANNLATSGNYLSSFAAVPVEGALVDYLRNNPTEYTYCWDTTGKVKQDATKGTGACPAGPY